MHTRRKLLRSTAINSGFLAEVMNASRSRRQVLVLDCCYSGAFSRGMIAKSDPSIPLTDYFQGAGRIVLTASDSMQYAFEEGNLMGSGTGSMFTRILVCGLETGQAEVEGLIERQKRTFEDEYEVLKDKLRSANLNLAQGLFSVSVHSSAMLDQIRVRRHLPFLRRVQQSSGAKKGLI